MYGDSHGYYGYCDSDDDDDDDESPVESQDYQPEIVLAAKRGDLAAVRSIVESAKTDRARRILVNMSGHWKEDFKRKKSYSSQNGKSTQPLEWHDETALLAAVAADCSETVEYLLRQCADPTLEAHPDYFYPVTSESILKRRINFRTNDKPENYLQNHDPSFVLDRQESPLEAAKRVFKRAHGHLRSAVLLGTALKFWNKADYSSSQFSHERQFSGYSNRPTDMDGLQNALDRIPPLPTPNEEILATLVSQITALRQAAELDDNLFEVDSPDEDYVPLHVKRVASSKSKKGKESPKKKKNKNKANNKNCKMVLSTYATACRFFAKGHCRFGDQCHFRHDM